tara:strand:- start:30 stop:668 length:639 start_codon:yes stop_codon:yes gene_type:complete
MKDLDWDEFSAAVRLLKSGVSRLYFRDVIDAATGQKIMPFDDNSNQILEEIKSWLDGNLNELSNLIEMDYVGRPNELGNYLERVLIARLDESLNFSVDMPTTEQGHKQAAGYPDGIIFDSMRNQVVYFDVKIFQEKTRNTTLRSFYYQPTNQSKILHDAPHFLIGFVVESLSGDNRSPFIIRDYELVDIYNLEVNFKAEFNASNKDLYQGGK